MGLGQEGANSVSKTTYRHTTKDVLELVRDFILDGLVMRREKAE